MSWQAPSLRIDAPRRVRRWLADAASDLHGPPAGTLRLRRRGLRRWQVDVAEMHAWGPLSATVHEAFVELNRLAAVSAVADHAVVHAGVVAYDGRAIALVGDSGSGKSTLTAAAVQAGAVFVADEVAVIDADGAVQPFPRPIGVRRGTMDMLGLSGRRPAAEGSTPVRASRLGQVATAPVGLAAIVLVQREADATETECTPLSAAEALVMLVHHTLQATGHEVEMFQRLDGLARRVPAYTVRYPDARRAVECLPGLAGLAGLAGVAGLPGLAGPAGGRG